MIYFEHIVLALAIQAAVGFLTGNWWAGAGLASAYFIGREAAQAEYRWIELYGEGLRANMPWWGPFDLRVWTKLDQLVDCLGPLVVTCALALGKTRR
ncbi:MULTISPECIES: hypothetical protein [unclassified Novosphingobium]|uniref:hypothetical protein n=1 Tax=unclassified Novosphingobium TaxID=2644732 RepID=UPI0013570B80|nr:MULTISPECIES: hypothetical protein [unclassified Novosphingobium]